MRKELHEHRVAIIGAGPAGLTTARACLKHGIRPVVFEANHDVGGQWLYGSPGSSVYKSTHLISSKEQVQFREFPIPENHPPYLNRKQAFEYLKSYAEIFDLYKFIRFNEAVRRCRKRHDGTWRIDTTKENDECFDVVFVCNGHHRDPNHPRFKGHFSGRMIHSQDYKEPSEFSGQRVLVVGSGNSGCDIAVEVSDFAKKTYHSTRRGYHYVPKFILGKPADHLGNKIRRSWIPVPLYQYLSKLISEFVMGKPEKFGLKKADYGIFESHPIINSQLFYKIGHGDVIPVDDIACLDDKITTLSDGSKVEVDTIIYSTGFKLSFPFLSDLSLNLNEAGLPVFYKNIFHPKDDTLLFIGLIQPNSGIWFLMESQANLAVKHVLLGSESKLHTYIKDEQETKYFNYITCYRNHLEVDYYRYSNELNRFDRMLEKQLLAEEIV